MTETLDALVISDRILAEAFALKSNLLEEAGNLIRELVRDRDKALIALSEERLSA